MPLPGPAVGDYLKPIRDVFRREKLTMYKHFRIRSGVPEPVAEQPVEAVARTAKRSKKAEV